MILLGAVLVVLAVLVVAAAAKYANTAASLNLGAFTFHTTAVGVFLAGAVTLLALVLGLWLIASGLRRGRMKRLEAKELRSRAEQSAQRESEQAARPVAPPRRKRGEKRRVRDEPVVVREEPVIVREPIEPPPSTPPGGTPAQTSRDFSGGADQRPSGASSAASPSPSTPPVASDGPDEHFDSAPREP